MSERLKQLEEAAENSMFERQDWDIENTTVPDGVILFDARCGRKGLIAGDLMRCLGCGVITVCLVVDASEGEYNTASICRSCIADVLRHAGKTDTPFGGINA